MAREPRVVGMSKAQNGHPGTKQNSKKPKWQQTLIAHLLRSIVSHMSWPTLHTPWKLRRRVLQTKEKGVSVGQS